MAVHIPNDILTGIPFLLQLIGLTLRTGRGVRKTHVLLPLFNAGLITVSVLLDTFIIHNDMGYHCLDPAAITGFGKTTLKSDN